MRKQTPAVLTAAIGSGLLLFSSTASAQSPPARMPRVMLSVGLGGTSDFDTLARLRSVALELLATRNLVLEAEATQWDMSAEREESFRYFGSCGYTEGCYYQYGAALAGIGAGAGGLIGALYDWRTAGSHIIYAASLPTARVTPLLAPGGAGVAVALKF